MRPIIQKLLILFLILLSSCNNDGNNNNKQTISVDAKSLSEKIKYQAGDPFIETFKKSEFFKISGLENHILETKSGTIISIPKGAFRDRKGNIVEKEIRIEINDIKSIEDQILSNMTSQQGGKAMQSGGFIYINATLNGEQLSLNEDSPIYVETSIKDPESDYLIFEGIRNDKGEMQWIKPTQPKKYLIPVDLDELDFLPEGFQLAVEKGMPFKNCEKADKRLIDSLYYSLKPYLEISNSNYDEFSHIETTYTPLKCKGIDPASIKILKTKKYSKTFISTRDFENRLKEIRKSKLPDLLDIYVNNLGLDMSKCDSMVVAKIPKSNSSSLKFSEFAHENLGNVKNLPQSIAKLGDYYSNKLKKTKKQLERLRNEYQNSLDKKDEKAIKIQNEYKRLLSQRLEYRLNKFGYQIKNLGWSNIAKVLEPLDKFKLEIVIENGSSFNRVNVYTIDQRIQSIFALTSDDNILFNRGYNDDPFLLFNKLQNATALVVAYKNGLPYLAIKDFKVTPVINITLSPVLVTMEHLKETLLGFDKGNLRFNKIQVDLEFQASFHKEKVRKEKLVKEREFINSLVVIAFDCNKIVSNEAVNVEPPNINI